MRLTLTPALSRKRERERAEPFRAIGELPHAPAETLLPLAGEGGPKGRMRVRRDVGDPLGDRAESA